MVSWVWDEACGLAWGGGNLYPAHWVPTGYTSHPEPILRALGLL